MDARTIAFYDAEPGRYATLVERHSLSPPSWLGTFADHLPAGGRVLDFGAGPGWAAAALAARGFAVEATDGSEGLAAEGRRRYGIEIRVEPFEALAAVAAFDGIWASFCLLHAPRGDLPDHMARLARALKPGGLLYVGLKEGAGEARDPLGRHYTYVSEAELRALLAGAGLALEDLGRDLQTGCAGGEEPCLHAFARRPVERVGS